MINASLYLYSYFCRVIQNTCAGLNMKCKNIRTSRLVGRRNDSPMTILHTAITAKTINVVRLHSVNVEEMYWFRVSLWSLRPTLNTPAEVRPSRANTSMMEVQDVYVAMIPYCVGSINRVKMGVVMKLIPFRKNEEMINAMEDLAEAGMDRHFLIKAFIASHICQNVFRNPF